MVIRLIIWIIFTLLVVFFVIFNFEPKVQVYFFPGVVLENIPLALVIVISFILGLLAGIILLLGEVIKYKWELRKIKKEKFIERKEVLGGGDEDQSGKRDY